MKNKQKTPQRNLRRFALWGGLEKERFVLRGGTLRFVFSERFVLRIILLRLSRAQMEHLDSESDACQKGPSVLVL